jgi:hypothetical protein
MATQSLTPVTVAAMRKVFALLEDNFDPEKGEYLHGYSDERIAKETSLSVDGVKKYRVDGFGKLKPPTELHKLQQEIAELEKLALQLDNDLRAGLKDVKARILNLQRKFD